jgi:Peptidase family M28
LISLALLAAATLDAVAIAQTSAALNALGPHPFGSPRNQAAAQFVAAKLKEGGLGQTVVEEFVSDGSPGSNVIARIPGRTDRLLIVATHHDSRKDAQDVSDRSRSLALLVEIAKGGTQTQPKKTWIVASFDGGESRGEGLKHFLDSLGRSADLVDGVFLIDAATLRASGEVPSLIVPACDRANPRGSRGIASHDMVEAALAAIPMDASFSFDDPGIALLTQPFIRAFKTPCNPTAASAVAAGLGVILASETSYSQRFLRPPDMNAMEAGARDDTAVRLGTLAFEAIRGLDGSVPPPRASDAWLVVGRTVWPGWLVFLLGVATLIPGLLFLSTLRTRFAFRAAYSVLFIVLLYVEPEVALFAGLIPNLFPPSLPAKFLPATFLPLLLLLLAGGFGFARGHVIGSWISPWFLPALVAAVLLLYASFGRGKKSAPRAKRGRK